MVCTHIKDLYKYAKEHEIKISAIDIINVECRKCKVKEACESIPV